MSVGFCGLMMMSRLKMYCYRLSEVCASLEAGAEAGAEEAGPEERRLADIAEGAAWGGESRAGSLRARGGRGGRGPPVRQASLPAPASPQHDAWPDIDADLLDTHVQLRPKHLNKYVHSLLYLTCPHTHTFNSVR